MSKEEKTNVEYVSIPLSEGDVVVQQVHSAPPSFARRLCRSFVLAFVTYSLFKMMFCHHDHHDHHHHMRHHPHHHHDMEEFGADTFSSMPNGPHHHHPGMMGPPHHHHHPGMMGPHHDGGHHGHHPHGPHHHHPHGPPPALFAFAWGEGEGMDEALLEDEESSDSPSSDSASSDEEDSSEDEEIIAVPAVAREDFVISEESP